MSADKSPTDRQKGHQSPPAESSPLRQAGGIRRLVSPTSSRIAPTDDDYQRYANNLMDIRPVLDSIDSLLSSGVDDELRSELVTEQLLSLETYQKEMKHIRQSVGTARSPPEWLVDLLNTVEPLCDRVIRELTRPQAAEAAAAAVSAEVSSPQETGTTGRTPGQLSPAGASEGSPLRDTGDITNLVASMRNITPLVDVASTHQVHGVEGASQPSQAVTVTATSSSSSSSSSQMTITRRSLQQPVKVEPIEYAAQGRSIKDWIDDQDHKAPQGVTKWRIDRTDEKFVLQYVFDKYKKAKNPELVRKLEVTFENESGIDRGALTREFFYMAFEATSSEKFLYKDVRLMTGEKGHLLPDPSADHVDYAYEYIGKMIVHAVRNGCRGFPGLSPAVQAYLVYGKGPSSLVDVNPPVSVDDVDDPDLKSVLTKLNAGDSLTKHEDEQLHKWLERSDCRVQLTDRTRLLIVQQLLVYYVLTRPIRLIDAIARGMELFDFRSFLRENATKENLAIVFPSPNDIIITPELFKGVVVNRGECFDMKIWEFFERFLKELSENKFDDHSLSDLVHFLSGSPYLPPQIVISFSDSDVTPVAHACYNELQLPTRHNSYESFRDSMLLGMAHHIYTLEGEQPS